MDPPKFELESVGHFRQLANRDHDPLLNPSNTIKSEIKAEAVLKTSLFL